MPFLAVGAWNLLVTLYLSPCTVHTSLGLAQRHRFPTSGAVVRVDSSTIDIEGKPASRMRRWFELSLGTGQEKRAWLSSLQ